MSEFEEAKARKEGFVTPLQLATNLAAACETGAVESIVYIVKRTDGELIVGNSAGSTLEFLGMSEIIKQEMLDKMRA